MMSNLFYLILPGLSAMHRTQYLLSMKRLKLRHSVQSENSIHVSARWGILTPAVSLEGGKAPLQSESRWSAMTGPKDPWERCQLIERAVPCPPTLRHWRQTYPWRWKLTGKEEGRRGMIFLLLSLLACITCLIDGSSSSSLTMAPPGMLSTPVVLN